MTQKPYETPEMEVYELPETFKLLVGTTTPQQLFGDPDNPVDIG